MDTRRDFLKKAMLLSGAAGVGGVLPESIQRAMAIDPKNGSTYLDAEHIVILMQENRSFDHCFGTLQGVRGFNDPRAITLPDKNLVWMQTDNTGGTYTPFHFDIRNTKATWIGSTPHSRSSQVDANNLGKYDQWLQSKRVGDKRFTDAPLTLGYYNREDIPIYYAMADAFTVGDHNFCSAMTSTNPNRLFLWTGTIREQQNGQSEALIRNLGNDRWGVLHFDTFPERLEDNGISWKFYQNDIDCGGGFTGDERAWLANFGCNPLEWFGNYNVRFSSRYIQGLHNQIATLPNEIKELEQKLQSTPDNDASLTKMQTALAKKKEVLYKARKDVIDFSRENYDKLSPKEKSLYQRAFTINSGDPYFHEVTTLSYEENGKQRSLPVPKGDVLDQFRKDAKAGQLPTVSWLSAAQNFSDHPSAPWYGSLYLSEILNILTENPEVWKKTIFLVMFDENDGYFDHVPPYVAPDPLDPATGKCSPGIDTDVEYIRLESELNAGIPKQEARGGPVGLGFRVPLLIASPWSRGGQVFSEVCDHTSVIKFVEGFVKDKFNKDVKETNISDWRRAITGDLTSAFKPFDGQKPKINFLKKDPFIKEIYNSKFKKDPSGFKPLSKDEIDQINKNPLAASAMKPHQEPGVRALCPVRYQLYADGKLSDDKKNFEINFIAKNEIFGKKSLGSPFNVYIPGKYAGRDGAFENPGSRSYAVVAGGDLSDSFPVQSFENSVYHVKVYGPNGFFRECAGKANDPDLTINCDYERPGKLIKKLTGNLSLNIMNLNPGESYTIEIKDNAYKNKPIKRVVASSGKKNGNASIILNLGKSFGWYDFTIHVQGYDHFERRYAGHVETGKTSFTDPFMGQA